MSGRERAMFVGARGCAISSRITARTCGKVLPGPDSSARENDSGVLRLWKVERVRVLARTRKYLTDGGQGLPERFL